MSAAKQSERLGLSSESEESSSISLELVVDKKDKGGDETGPEHNIYDFDLDTTKDKPWLRPGANLTDYFNYGFTEHTWKKYCELQKQNREWAMNEEANERGRDERWTGGRDDRRGYNQKRDDAR